MFPSATSSVKMDSPEPLPSTSTSTSSPQPPRLSPMMANVTAAPLSPSQALPTTPPRLHPCFPAPKDISRGELQVLQGCLQRWRKEVETNVKELQSSISHYDAIMQAMYRDGELQKVGARYFWPCTLFLVKKNDNLKEKLNHYQQFNDKKK